jgi:ribonuclease HII
MARERLDADIRLQAVAFGLGKAEATEIDALGMTVAIRLAMERALAQITVVYREIVIDGAFNFLKHNPKARCLTKADTFMPSVSAASILAKVARDKLMANMANEFPGYGFETHVGYGTAAHSAALERLGPCHLHRHSFKPLQALR